ncbi:MAG: hypothetical protein LBR13_07165 [Dysgonamonadaceae bacterium]|jgi:hypothetical protein|nr:hypothetical protein [Dysgonamonadaceae bacterium]
MKEVEEKETIIALAQHALHYTELLIAQCDGWLSEEEGMKNMEKRLSELQKCRKKHAKKKYI